MADGDDAVVQLEEAPRTGEDQPLLDGDVSNDHENDSESAQPGGSGQGGSIASGGSGHSLTGRDQQSSGGHSIEGIGSDSHEIVEGHEDADFHTTRGSPASSEVEIQSVKAQGGGNIPVGSRFLSLRNKLRTVRPKGESVMFEDMEEKPYGQGRKVKLLNLPIPTFGAHTKEDINVFFDQMETVGDIYGWSERQILATALASLRANAHAWAMGLDREEKGDYLSFKDLAIETFKKTVPQWLRAKVLLSTKQRPGQDSQAYAASLRQKQLSVQATGDAMLAAYLCGLNEKLSQMVAMYDPQSFEEAARLAKKFEAITQSKDDSPQGRYPRGDRSRNFGPPRSQALDHSRQEGWGGNGPSSNAIQARDMRTTPGQEANGNQMYCSYHGNCAHTTSSCRELNQQKRSPLNGQRAPNQGPGPATTHWRQNRK